MTIDQCKWSTLQHVSCPAANASTSELNIGHIKTDDFQYADGQVKGGLATDGPIDVFGETWEVNLKFVAPLGEIPKEFQPAASKEPEENATNKPAPTTPTTELSEKAAPKPAADQLNVKDLALTKDASNVEYNQLVEQLNFKSKANVKNVCAELSTNLKNPRLDQGRQRSDHAGVFHTEAETGRR